MLASVGNHIERLWRPEIQRMHVPSLGRSEAELLATLATAIGARRALELGTAVGYSTAYLAAGVGAGGRVTTVELNPERSAVARRLWAAAGLADRIELHEGDALRLAPTLGTDYDLVFVDLLWELGRRELGRQLAQHVVVALRPGGVLVADNCAEQLPAAEGFVGEVIAGSFSARTLLPLRDGMLLAVKR